MRRIWFGLVAVLVVSFGVLGWVGTRIYQLAPPVPDRVMTSDGHVVFGPGEVEAGQDVWRSFGGMEMGSIWGHGAYVAPDWTADWLHRELAGVLDVWAVNAGTARYDLLSAEAQAGLRERLAHEFRTNTFDAATHTIAVSAVRAQAIEANVQYYTALFANGREQYALPRGAVADPGRARSLAAFFYW
jgi:nitric oxide reductase subunit B